MSAPETAKMEQQQHPDTPAYPVEYRRIATILDSLDALVYVADMQTHELLFFNAYGQAAWGDPAGRLCWQVLQTNQQAPCSFCTNPKLLDQDGKPTGVHVWEFQNTATGRWYQCRDQAIEWVDGRLVRLEIATDITDRKQMEQELESVIRRAETLAHTDELTGLNNRRAFFDLGAQTLRQAKLLARPVAVIMFDVDHFKRINDTYGHTIGDEVLRALASCVRSLIRDGDILGRIGGEEFALILPNTAPPQALAVAQRLQAAVAALRLPGGSDAIRCTCSFGIANCADGGMTLEALLIQADHALLAAKNRGRNRVEHAQPVLDASHWQTVQQ